MSNRKHPRRSKYDSSEVPSKERIAEHLQSLRTRMIDQGYSIEKSLADEFGSARSKYSNHVKDTQEYVDLLNEKLSLTRPGNNYRAYLSKYGFLVIERVQKPKMVKAVSEERSLLSIGKVRFMP